MKRKIRNNPQADPRLADEQYLDEDESQIEEEFRYRPERTERLPRGEFQRRHPGFDPKTAHVKVRVTIDLDADVLASFKEQAAQPSVASYQTQINQTLRQAMERARTQGTTEPPANTAAVQAALLGDKQFIKAVAEQVAHIRQSSKRKRPKAA